MRSIMLGICCLVMSACGVGGAEPGQFLPDFTVDAVNGSDLNNGSLAAPFKTITHALGVVQAGDSIRVLAGTYDVINGESFPLIVPPGVRLVGDTQTRGDGRLVKGSGVVPSWAGPQGTPAPVVRATVVLDATAQMSGLHINNPTPTPATDVCVLMPREDALLAQCTIDRAAEFGVYLLNQAHRCEVRGNFIRNNPRGVYIRLLQVGDDIRIQDNQINGNATGVYCAAGRVDLGGGMGGSLGGNTIAGNTVSDLQVLNPAGHVFARFNAWDHAPPTNDITSTPGLDIYRVALGAPPATVDASNATLAP